MCITREASAEKRRAMKAALLGVEAVVAVALLCFACVQASPRVRERHTHTQTVCVGWSG